LATLKKISQRGLLATAIMLPLILVFYSLADAAPRTINILCGQDIDEMINRDERGIATRFVLQANCAPLDAKGPKPFVASATIVPSNGDEVACTAKPEFVQRGPAFDPTTRCTVAGNGSVENVFRPIGQGGTTATVRFEGIKITGGNYTGSTGSGAAIAEGSMTNLSSHYGIEVMDNEAAGILSAKGTFDSVEFTNNTLVSNALGVIGTGMKARNEVEVKNSYVHHTQGNGLWRDNYCEDSPTNTHPKGFWVHHNLVVNNRRAGIRFERVGDVSTAGEALIENNEVHGNSADENRGGISVRDAQNATIQNNRFGKVTIGKDTYDPNDRAAIIASDSGRSSRPDLRNILIENNVLNGEIIKGCELPDTIVRCPGYTR
jgi:parallel beta-helix repeat protein